MKRSFALLIAICFLLAGCTNYQRTRIQSFITPPLSNPGNNASPLNASLINGSGETIAQRIQAPVGFERVTVADKSFGDYLRNLSLKPHGSPVRYFDGNSKPSDVHIAVLDMDVGERDLQQCADAVMRLRAEYLYGRGEYDQIHFNFTNGFKAEYSKWMQGYRVSVSGNNTSWVKRTNAVENYESFRKYLDIVFAYAGTASLEKEMQNVQIEDMQIGDVFIKGGSPGHCVIIVDMAENKETGEKLFLLAQSYMPAQEIHVLKNPKNDDDNPWYSLKIGETLDTPEWDFSTDQLMRFK